MVDYIELLREDLVEQFKEKEVIDALIEAIGEQLNDVRGFFESLKNERTVLTATGQQLDGVGDIVGLTRLKAGEWACINESVYVLDDDTYRTFLLFKIWKNTNNCTYYDIMNSFRMFWSKPLYYSEDPAKPATMILESNLLTPDDNPQRLLTAPIIKAAGVGVKIIANTETPGMTTRLHVVGMGGRGYMDTTLPEIDMIGSLVDTVMPIPMMQNIMQTKLSEIKEVAE